MDRRAVVRLACRVFITSIRVATRKGAIAAQHPGARISINITEEIRDR